MWGHYKTVKRTVLGYFAKLWKATISFVMSVRLSVCNNSGSHRTDFHENCFWIFYQNLSTEFKFELFSEYFAKTCQQISNLNCFLNILPKPVDRIQIWIVFWIFYQNLWTEFKFELFSEYFTKTCRQNSNLDCFLNILPKPVDSCNNAVPFSTV
jgi:hypothetical protein